MPTRLIEEDKHDLSHEVFYHQNGYSLIRLTGGMDCKNAVYTPPQGEKAANSDGEIYLKYAADFLLGPAANGKTSILSKGKYLNNEQITRAKSSRLTRDTY